jgi:hypothetical protein
LASTISLFQAPALPHQFHLSISFFLNVLCVSAAFYFFLFSTLLPLPHLQPFPLQVHSFSFAVSSPPAPQTDEKPANCPSSRPAEPAPRILSFRRQLRLLAARRLTVRSPHTSNSYSSYFPLTVTAPRPSSTVQIPLSSSIGYGSSCGYGLSFARELSRAAHASVGQKPSERAIL